MILFCINYFINVLINFEYHFLMLFNFKEKKYFSMMKINLYVKKNFLNKKNKKKAHIYHKIFHTNFTKKK